MKLRIGIARVCNASSPLSGEVEAEEFYLESWNAAGKLHGNQSLTPPRSSYRERSGVG